jgi:hemerythrin-like domain-containing protein
VIAVSNLLRSPAPGFDDPLGLLRACHGRIRERLDTLERLPAHLAAHGADRDAQLASRRILEYFDRAAPHHHADEDADLFPLLLACPGRPGWDTALPELLRRLDAEHPQLEAGWARLRPVLQAVAEGEGAVSPEAADWIAASRAHLALEEERVLPLAERVLTPEELARLGRSMAARRNVEFP